MIRKFHKDNFRWDGLNRIFYKKNPGVFRDVTKQVLFDNEEISGAVSVFPIGKGWLSSLEHHEHMHMVIIFRGRGHALLGHDDVGGGSEEGDFITIPMHGSFTSSARIAVSRLLFLYGKYKERISCISFGGRAGRAQVPSGYMDFLKE